MRLFRTPALLLAESGEAPPKKIQLFRVGTFHHSEYGQFSITPEVLKAMEKNFKANVRGIDLAIDYKHENEDKAAGWIKSVMLGEDGQSLWAEVEWTPNGQRVLAEKEFRYISPEFSNDYRDNENLKAFGPTLLGAGLTNRPVIKKMEPVMELSEFKYDELDDAAKKWIGHFIKSGLPQDQAVAAAYAKAKKELGIKSAEDVAGQTPAPNKGPVPKEMKAMEMDPAKVDAMGPEELKALCKELMAKMGEMQSAAAAEKKVLADKVACMEAEKKLAEKKGAFAKMLSEGKVCAAQEQAYLDGDMVKFAENAKPLNPTATGTGAAPAATVSEGTREEAEKEVLKLAEKKLSEKKAKTKGDAISMVLAERADLATKLSA